MKNKRNVLYSLMIMLTVVINVVVQAQQKKDVSTSQGPNGIVRTVKQDRKGNIWITSWEGVYKYDGKSFTNVTIKASSARFFSVLEDRKGNFWFASIGSGVYYYDGKSFRNFTTKDGLAGDSVTAIYEDQSGNVWFGTGNGASRYDGKTFRNLKMSEAPSATPSDSLFVGPQNAHTQNDSLYVETPVRKATDSVQVASFQPVLPKTHWMHNDVNAVMEDNTGKFWIGTRGYASIYDGKTFTTIINTDGKPFTNVRSIIKDKKGNMWLGGADGLWRYDGKTFTRFTQKFVGYIIEDKKGNIWTSSESTDAPGWVLSRYDGKTLSDKKPTVTEIRSKYEGNKGFLFDILEANDGSIWFGGMDGVYRYDGKTIMNFKSKK